MGATRPEEDERPRRNEMIQFVKRAVREWFTEQVEIHDVLPHAWDGRQFYVLSSAGIGAVQVARSGAKVSVNLSHFDQVCSITRAADEDGGGVRIGWKAHSRERIPKRLGGGIWDSWTVPETWHPEDCPRLLCALAELLKTRRYESRLVLRRFSQVELAGDLVGAERQRVIRLVRAAEPSAEIRAVFKCRRRFGVLGKLKRWWGNRVYYAVASDAVHILDLRASTCSTVPFDEIANVRSVRRTAGIEDGPSRSTARNRAVELRYTMWMAKPRKSSIDSDASTSHLRPQRFVQRRDYLTVRKPEVLEDSIRLHLDAYARSKRTSPGVVCQSS